ncbi:SPFH domain-containing protein [Pseudoduganella violaceinigra]|uniref:SPFH domain-containing protein n=1 Tax=Pseudoduganella violaceinigra TaxID=246602 RepID=UPI0004075286|nr:SPFH domain-containing protein [Pseudoduganella violaceinigra]
MFKMFGFGGVKCPRCEHRNGDSSGYCNQCGLSLGAPHSEPVLRENRWIPANDELAVYFGMRQLSGIFTKTLRVPASTRAYILQGDSATEVPPGDYELEGFFTRLANLLRDQQGEILITRTTPLPVEFNFTDLHSAESLKLAARFTVALQVEDVPAFARHFMTVPGSVTTLQLHELLAPSVRQVAAEFLGSRPIRDMASSTVLREQLNERLHNALRQRLAEFGLAVERVEVLALRHDKYDDNRERVGSLFLIADERQAQLEHVKQIDKLYDEEEWQAIWRQEQKMRTDYRKAELKAEAEEQMQGIRGREIDLYGRIAEAKSRKQAFDFGAGMALADLEHELARHKTLHTGEAAQWEQVRRLAQIRMRTEMELAQQAGLEEKALAKQRFSHQIYQQQLRYRIEQALAIEDEEYRRNQLQFLRRAETDAKQREAEIEAEHHRAKFQGIALANAARHREAERIAEWEEGLHLARKREMARGEEAKDAGARVQVAEISAKMDELKRSGASAESIDQYEKLLRTIESDGVQQRQTQGLARQAMLDQVAVEEQRLELKLRDQEAQWQQALKKMEVERDERFQRWKVEYGSMVAQQQHTANMARIDIERLESIGRMSDTAKIALAATPNAEALSRLMRQQAQSAMSPEQLQALAAVVAAENSITPAEALRLAREEVRDERSYRDSAGDKERQHQLDLLRAQASVGAVTAQRCPNGHSVPTDCGDAKFCPECGAPLAR